jgi:hypothetical protein
MAPSAAWDAPASPVRPCAGRAWSKWFLGLSAVLVLLLAAAALRASADHPRLARDLFHRLDDDTQARQLYRTTPGLRAGFGSEEAFLRHVRTWKPLFGTQETFEGPDAKRFLPFAAKLEVQGSHGAWFAILARQGPAPRIHGIAFGATREQARNACFNQYAKAFMGAWLERGLAQARRLGESLAQGIPGATLTETDRKVLRGLPDLPALDPGCFTFQFLPGGARLDLELAPERTLALRWQGDGPESPILAGLEEKEN